MVVSRDQVPVKLKQVAQLSDGLADMRALARFNGREGVVISVVKVRNANTVAVVQTVKEVLNRDLRRQLPDGVELLVATDESSLIKDIIAALRSHLVEGTLLAGLVVFFFLLNVPATLIIGTAVPVSLAGAIVVMYFGGFTLNVLTMSGLLLLIGVVVDDAIVVLENIHRQHESAATDPDKAAVCGTNEVVLPVIAASLTLLCIFGTVIFMEGNAGVFFRSFAVVVAVGVATSLLVSLSLTPAICARYLTANKPPQNRVLLQLEHGHRWAEATYQRLLIFSLHRRGLIMLLSLILVLSSGWFLTQLGSEFFPEDDESRFRVRLKVPLGSSIEYTIQKLDEAEEIIGTYPEVLHVLSSVGSARSGDVNEAILHVQLTPKQQRSESQQSIMNRTRQDLKNVAGIESFVSLPPIMEGMNENPFEAVITGPDVEGIAYYAHQVYRDLNLHAGLGDISLELDLSRPQLSFEIDRDRARALGISTQQIGDTIRVLAGGTDIAKYNGLPGDGERHDVQLTAIRQHMRELRDLENIYLKTPGNQLVTLGSVVTIKETIGPAVIDRTDLQYSARLSSTPEIPASEVAQIFAKTATAILPAGYGYKFSGQTDEMHKTTRALLFAFTTGLILVYMVLASQFNSFLQPGLIMLAQPLAIVGGVMALWFAGSTLNIFSMIGLVLLVGLVSKNSILLVDLVNQYRNQGMDTRQAILNACPRRMRPVLMTSMTIVLAMSPAAVGVGAGAGLYGPLAIAVIGGVISSTLLTLVVVPVAYDLLERWLAVQEKSSNEVREAVGLVSDSK